MAKILIVDRSAKIRALVKKTLEERGHTVFEAADGVNGLVHFKREKPACTIISRGTYLLRGSQVLQEIKKASPDAKVVILTRLHDAEGMKKYKELGADLFMSKDVLLGRLVEEIEKLIGAAEGG